MQDNFSLSFFLILTFTKIIAIDYFIIFDDPLMEWKFLNLTTKIGKCQIDISNILFIQIFSFKVFSSADKRHPLDSTTIDKRNRPLSLLKFLLPSYRSRFGVTIELIEPVSAISSSKDLGSR